MQGCYCGWRTGFQTLGELSPELSILGQDFLGQVLQLLLTQVCFQVRVTVGKVNSKSIENYFTELTTVKYLS